MKTKILFIALPLLLTGLVASAQISSGYVSATQTSPASVPSVLITPTVPQGGMTIMPINEGGEFIQFNDLTVLSISSKEAPGEIVANVNYPYPVPMLDTSGGTKAMNAGGVGAQSASPTSPVGIPKNCFKFTSKDAKVSTAIPCPTPPQTSQQAGTVTTGNTLTVTGSSAPQAAAVRGTAVGADVAVKASGVMYPSYPQMSYRIKVNTGTMLLFRDRTRATLSGIAAGDQINVFGYYNQDGSIEAYLVRDTSKPIEQQTLQLNNMTLIGISGTTIPATLAVTDTMDYNPCYRFDLKSTKMTIACPMGATDDSLSANIKVNDMISPNWRMQRKYAVVIDASTIILDRNRKQLTLSDLKEGDSLNIYGESSDNGQTITADIVRDMTLPATPVNMSGTISTVNTDGSFVITTSDGKTVIVRSPLKAGAAVTVGGMYDSRQGTLTNVTQIYFGGTIIYPYPVDPPMMLKASAPVTR